MPPEPDLVPGVVCAVDAALVELAGGSRTAGPGRITVFVPAAMVTRVIERGPCALLGVLDAVAIGAVLIGGSVVTVIDVRSARARQDDGAPVGALLCKADDTEFVFVPERVAAAGAYPPDDEGGVWLDDARVPRFDVAGLYGRVYGLVTRRDLLEEIST